MITDFDLQLAEEYGAMFMEVSAKTGKNVGKVLVNFVECMQWNVFGFTCTGISGAS